MCGENIHRVIHEWNNARMTKDLGKQGDISLFGMVKAFNKEDYKTASDSFEKYKKIVKKINPSQMYEPIDRSKVSYVSDCLRLYTAIKHLESLQKK
jgi:hypothetical protein